ncbi:MAG: prepilin-type N-terminal cleavage/methylation domain-containing protein [Desulfobulbus sp.]|nr:prepilin-type N-terminal cleavage/methylation domain-containing protein [Desulfobulbus sp.]
MPTHTAQQGFTLIEVIIAMAILIIGILAAGTMQIGALNGNAEAKQLFRSVVWSMDHLEQMMNAPLILPDRPEPIADRLNFTDEAGRIADGSFVDAPNNLTTFWNVADRYPVVGCATIRVIVRRFGQGLDKTQAKTIAMDFIRIGAIGATGDGTKPFPLLEVPGG